MSSTAEARRAARPPLGATTWLGIVLLGGFGLLATVGRWLSGSPTALVDDVLLPPSARHPFGTDNLGRDLFARTAEGAWSSLSIAVCAIALALLVAVPLGTYAAWASGRWTATAVMRVVETAQVVPQFVLVVLILGLTGPGDIERWGVTTSTTTRLVLVLALGFVPFFARITRAAALRELEEDYVDGLRLLGVSNRELLVGEVAPNIAPVVGVQVFLALAIAVFAEGGLSFLGLGVPAPAPTLGNLIAEAGSQLLDDAWWYALIPGLVLVAGITGCNLVGDAAADRLLGVADAVGAGRFEAPLDTDGVPSRSAASAAHPDLDPDPPKAQP